MAGTRKTRRPSRSRGAESDADRVIDALSLRAGPMTIDELRDAIGGDRESAREAVAQAIAGGRARMARAPGEALFSAPRFEIVPPGRVLDREIKRSLDPRARPTDLAGEVLRAALAISGGRGRRVMLTDLRRALPGVGRRELDDTLVSMSRTGRIALFPNDDRYSITDEDRRDAVNLSGVPQHILYLP